MGDFSVKCVGAPYKGLSGGHCTIENSGRRLNAVVTQEGGRIISLGVQGVDIVDSKPALFPGASTLLLAERANVTWDKVGIGGERTWVAPQSGFGGGVPFLDLDLGMYAIEQDGTNLTLTSPKCRETGLQVIRKIMPGHVQEDTFSIEAQVINNSSGPRIASPWEILQTKVPMAVRVGPLAGAPVVFDEFGDPLKVDGFATQQRDGYWLLDFKRFPNIPMFKIGFHFDNNKSENGTILASYSNGTGGAVQILESFKLLEGPFPHKGQAELFYNPFGNYIEIEVLGNSQTLQPNQKSEVLKLDLQVNGRTP